MPELVCAWADAVGTVTMCYTMTRRVETTPEHHPQVWNAHPKRLPLLSVMPWWDRFCPRPGAPFSSRCALQASVRLAINRWQSAAQESERAIVRRGCARSLHGTLVAAPGAT